MPNLIIPRLYVIGYRAYDRADSTSFHGVAYAICNSPQEAESVGLELALEEFDDRAYYGHNVEILLVDQKALIDLAQRQHHAHETAQLTRVPQRRGATGGYIR